MREWITGNADGVMYEALMEVWRVPWEQMDSWTDEIFNLFVLKRSVRMERLRAENMRANAKAQGNVVFTDDEIAGKV